MGIRALMNAAGGVEAALSAKDLPFPAAVMTPGVQLLLSGMIGEVYLPCFTQLHCFCIE